jgi:hypothetical protein
MRLGGVSYRCWATGFLLGLIAVWSTDAAPAQRPAKPPVIPSSRVHVTILGFESTEAATPGDAPIQVVHTVFTSRELFTASYDTWFANRRLTDVIAARWLETSGFKRPAPGPPGVLSLYQPLEPSRRADLRSPESVRALALAALNDITDMIPALANEPMLEIESYRWPSSIHVVPVNFFSQWARKLREPVGRVYFAGNNLGTPSFEEALYRGWRAAQEIRPRLATGDC